jgi:hypothetical protein
MLFPATTSRGYNYVVEKGVCQIVGHFKIRQSIRVSISRRVVIDASTIFWRFESIVKAEATRLPSTGLRIL